MLNEFVYYLDKDYQKKSLGILINQFRKKANISLNQLAQVLNISTQFLHEIEKGKKKGNAEIYRSVFIYFNIRFYDNLDAGQKYIHLFNELIGAYIDMDSKKRNQIAQEILSDPYIQTSYFYPIFYLTQFVQNKLGKRQNEAEEDILVCEEIFSLFTKDQRAIYFYFRGMHASRFEKGKEYDYYSRSLHESSDSEISAMAYYMIGKYQTVDHNFANAINNLNISKEILIKHNHFHRVVYPTIVLGIVYIQMRQTQLMEEYLFSASKIALNYNDQENHFIAIMDIAGGHLKLSNYDRCVQVSLQLLQEGCNDYRLYYYLAWSYYMLDDKENASKYRDLLVKNNKHDFTDINNYEICLNYLLAGKYEAYFNKLKKYYETCKKKNSMEDNDVLLERLVNYCDENQLIEEGYYYQKEYIKLLKKFR